MRRGLLTQPAFTMLGRAADILGPVRDGTSGAAVISLAAGLAAYVVQCPRRDPRVVLDEARAARIDAGLAGEYA